MKQTLALVLALCVTFAGPFAGISANAESPASAPGAVVQDSRNDQDYQDYQDDEDSVSFSDEQLENLLAPIALYPDPLLAQVLLAATFPDQIDEAARAIRAYGPRYDIDDTDWDLSVKAVAHYPTVLSMMADKIDWTTSLGQAYVEQSTDVMDAVQRLRRDAQSAGYLESTPQSEIVDTDGELYIYPAQPEYIYVPVYDPAVVFVVRPGYRSRAAIWFGTGFLIGAWLNHDCDWRSHRVYYHGWDRGPAWVLRSRPHIHITNIYVNNRYRNVVVNRNVINRRVNYGSLTRYNNVHRDVHYDNVRRPRGGAGAGQRREPPQVDAGRDNKIIRRNIDPRDPRIDANRGGHPRDTRPPDMKPIERPRPGDTRPPNTRPPDMKPIERPRPGDNRPPNTRPPDMKPIERPRPGDLRPPDTRPPDMKPIERPRPEIRPQDRPRPMEQRPPQTPQVQTQPAQHGGFQGGAGAIDTGSASRRGNASRQEPPRPPAPAPRQAAPPPRQAAPPSQNQPPAGQNRGHERGHS